MAMFMGMERARALDVQAAAQIWAAARERVGAGWTRGWDLSDIFADWRLLFGLLGVGIWSEFLFGGEGEIVVVR
jgi:hypothetical protein